jgi:hypothetical protein
MTEDQKYNLVQIYNRSKPPHCAYRGAGSTAYPNRDHYLRQFDIYYNEANLI